MYTPKNREKEIMSCEASTEQHSYTVSKSVRFSSGLCIVHIFADTFMKEIKVMAVAFKSLIVLDLVQGFLKMFK